MNTNTMKIPTTPMLPPDPEEKNDERALWAQEALCAFEEATRSGGEEPGTSCADLLCDLMHWCDREALSFDALLETARMHYLAETDDGLGEETP